MAENNPLTESMLTLSRLRKALDIIVETHHSVEVEDAIELAQQLFIDLNVAESKLQKP